MNQTRDLGVVNDNKNAAVHAVYQVYPNVYGTLCTAQLVHHRVALDPSGVWRLCQRCFKDRPLPWTEPT